MEAVFHEASASNRVSELPFSHVSVELGHLYMEDLDGGMDLSAYFSRVAPWADQRILASLGGAAPRRLRVSTCLLIDDYFTAPRSPALVIPELVAAAAESGLSIDYIARESGCAETEQASLASIVEGAIVSEPPAGTTGSRPPLTETGWLSNGARSPATDPSQAMRTPVQWKPPLESSARRHSIFVDVELWNTSGTKRVWSCPYLAAVWQLLRLGLLRVEGEPPATPVFLEPDAVPKEWDEFPPVACLNARAAPFFAYRTLSIMGGRFLPIENAVRTILAQVAVDPPVLSQSLARSGSEGIDIPGEIPDRISYAFLPA
jgi:hypothetical protein